MGFVIISVETHKRENSIFFVCYSAQYLVLFRKLRAEQHVDIEIQYSEVSEI